MKGSYQCYKFHKPHWPNLAQIQCMMHMDMDAITLNSKIHRNKARAWDVALSDSTSKKCSNSAFPTSKHQKTSDLEVSDDLENLSVPTLWRISKFEEVFSSTQRGTYANLKIVSQILTVPNLDKRPWQRTYRFLLVLPWACVKGKCQIALQKGHFYKENRPNNP